MANFYENLTAEDVVTLDRLARLLLELRENRAALLAPYGARDESELLEQIRLGRIAEHPAYESYLGARSISATREAIREDLKRYLLTIRLP